MTLCSPATGGADWLETADRVTLLPDGGFRFAGRADRIAKIEGKRVSLTLVETQLAALEGVEEAAVTLVEGRFQRLAAVVVPSAGGRKQLAALGPFRFGRLLRRELGHDQEAAGLPRLWRFVDALPIGPMGKRRESEVARLFDGEAGS